jgi:hypothetical protein
VDLAPSTSSYGAAKPAGDLPPSRDTPPHLDSVYVDRARKEVASAAVPLAAAVLNRALDRKIVGK